jgi:hypothetical protein
VMFMSAPFRVVSLKIARTSAQRVRGGRIARAAMLRPMREPY